MQKWIRMDGIFILCQSTTNLGNSTQFSHLRKPSEGGINGDWNSKLEHFCNTAPAKKRDANHQTELLFVTPTLMFRQNFILCNKTIKVSGHLLINMSQKFLSSRNCKYVIRKKSNRATLLDP